jgi:protein-L-isoaspartate(D-aspartate) O-methyltransferase
MIDFSSARRMMLDGQLRAGGVTDLKVLSAFNSIPREDFVPEARRSIAYSDSAHPLPSSGAPRSLAAPAIFARLLQLATIAPGDRIFDFCAGNGYSSAVLAALGADVLAYEADDLLAQAARANRGGLRRNCCAQ